ncbi:hypothetical protein NXS19_009990 [Fusarium pseudograminearum]|nr:hypothetical protein NXS19_009990 [Fusarium pseudograminearum]
MPCRRPDSRLQTTSSRSDGPVELGKPPTFKSHKHVSVAPLLASRSFPITQLNPYSGLCLCLCLCSAFARRALHFSGSSPAIYNLCFGRTTSLLPLQTYRTTRPFPVQVCYLLIFSVATYTTSVHLSITWLVRNIRTEASNTILDIFSIVM